MHRHDLHGRHFACLVANASILTCKCISASQRTERIGQFCNRSRPTIICQQLIEYLPISCWVDYGLGLAHNGLEQPDPVPLIGIIAPTLAQAVERGIAIF